MDRRRESLGFWAVYGLVLWAIGTVGLRLAGHYLFVPGRPLRLAAAYVLAVPLVLAVTYPAYERLGVLRSQRPRAAGAIVAANVVPDAFALGFFGALFPNMDPGAAAHVGAWLLWCYGLIVLTGLTGSWRRRSAHVGSRHAMGGTR